jgi:hypothetical protein
MYERETHILNSLLKDIFGETNYNGQFFFIAGGALTSVFSGTQINDLDFFFYSESGLESMKNIFESDKKYPLKFSTDSALSYSCNGIKVQLIKKIYGNEWDIIKQFDFKICMAAFNPVLQSYTVDNDFFYDLSRRRLTYNPGNYPIASLWRVKKFIKRGYEFPPIDSIKLALTINNLHISTYEELKSQLEGIDTAFLKDLTDMLIEKSGEKYDIKVAFDMMDRILMNKLDVE